MVTLGNGSIFRLEHWTCKRCESNGHSLWEFAAALVMILDPAHHEPRVWVSTPSTALRFSGGNGFLWSDSTLVKVIHWYWPATPFWTMGCICIKFGWLTISNPLFRLQEPCPFAASISLPPNAAFVPGGSGTASQTPKLHNDESSFLWRHSGTQTDYSPRKIPEEYKKI